MARLAASEIVTAGASATVEAGSLVNAVFGSLGIVVAGEPWGSVVVGAALEIVVEFVASQFHQLRLH